MHLLARTDKMSELALLSIQIASFAIVGAIILLVIKKKIEIIDYIVLIYVIWRIAVTFMLFKVISEGWSGVSSSRM